jgi:hypothetical protein
LTIGGRAAFTLIVENAAIFQGEYARFTFAHLVKVMANLEPNKIL